MSESTHGFVVYGEDGKIDVHSDYSGISLWVIIDSYDSVTGPDSSDVDSEASMSNSNQPTPAKIANISIPDNDFSGFPVIMVKPSGAGLVSVHNASWSGFNIYYTGSAPKFYIFGPTEDVVSKARALDGYGLSVFTNRHNHNKVSFCSRNSPLQPVDFGNITFPSAIRSNISEYLNLSFDGVKSVDMNSNQKNTYSSINGDMFSSTLTSRGVIVAQGSTETSSSCGEWYNRGKRYSYSAGMRQTHFVAGIGFDSNDSLVTGWIPVSRSYGSKKDTSGCINLLSTVLSALTFGLIKMPNDPGMPVMRYSFVKRNSNARNVMTTYSSYYNDPDYQ